MSTSSRMLNKPYTKLQLVEFWSLNETKFVLLYKSSVWEVWKKKQLYPSLSCAIQSIFSVVKTNSFVLFLSCTFLFDVQGFITLHIYFPFFFGKVRKRMKRDFVCSHFVQLWKETYSCIFILPFDMMFQFLSHVTKTHQASHLAVPLSKHSS